MPDKEKASFISWLTNPDIHIYYEFGSGGSTYKAIHAENITKIYSVESDTAYFNSTMATLVSDKLERIHVSVGAKNNLGYPSSSAKYNDWSLYFKHIDSIDTIPDLVLIDGRWRVACALHTWMRCDTHTIILFDDYYDRPHYHIVDKYFTTIERVGRMAVLRKKPEAMAPAASVLSNYENDAS